MIEKPYEQEKTECQQDESYPLQKDRLVIPGDMLLAQRGASYSEEYKANCKYARSHESKDDACQQVT